MLLIALFRVLDFALDSSLFTTYLKLLVNSQSLGGISGLLIPRYGNGYMDLTFTPPTDHRQPTVFKKETSCLDYCAI